MPIAVGINKKVFYKKETSWGVLEAAGAANVKTLRRVTSNFNLEKESYQSGEIRTDYQVSDMRHGVKSVTGSVSGELSPGTYADFIGSSVAKTFVAGVAAGAQVITVGGTNPNFTLSRASGSFLTDGFKVGDVVRMTVAAAGAGDVDKNLLVTAITAGTGVALTVITLDGSTLSSGPTAASCVVKVHGKKTWAPLTGHLDESYNFEEFYADILQTEVTVGNKVNTLGLSMPASGLVTVDVGFMGKDMAQTGTAQYFTTPAAQTSSGIFAAVNGALLIGGVKIATVTGVNVNINRNMSNATVVGSNSVAEMFEGRISVEGDFSAYFENAVFRDLFRNETEASLVVALTTSNAKDADFMTVVLPRIKVNSNGRDDGEQGITAQHSFTALLNTTGGTGVATEATTISFQDSLA